MKKLFFVSMLALASSLVFYACKKQDGPTPSNTNLEDKANLWLEAQKLPGKKNKNSNIDLLKKNLDFGRSRMEQLNKEETLLLVPVNESFRQEKKVAENVLVQLILTLDRAHNIKRGVLVLYTPSGTKQVGELPLNTFQKIYNYKDLEVDGQFKFLSVTGRWIYQLEYKEGKLHSCGIVKSSASANRTSMMCSDHYLVTTIYVGGVVVDEIWDYIGTVCVGDCDDPSLASLCGDGGGGGGGDSNQNCCIPDANMQLVSSSINETVQNDCGPEGVDANGKLIKTCTHVWYYNTSTLLWYTWKYKSIETAELEKEGDIWKFKTVTHTGNSIEGILPACTSFTDGITAVSPSISADRRQAKMELAYWISGRITCIPWASPTIINSMASTTWRAI